MRLTVTVLHNVSRDMFVGFNPQTSHLHHAHTFEVTADNTEQAAELVWTLTNVDDRDHLHYMRPDLGQYGDAVTAYRARSNRSLSVGDVLLFHEGERQVGAIAVESVGWKQITDYGYTDGDNTTDVSMAYLASQAYFRQANARGGN